MSSSSDKSDSGDFHLLAQARRLDGIAASASDQPMKMNQHPLIFPIMSAVRVHVTPKCLWLVYCP